MLAIRQQKRGLRSGLLKPFWVG